MAEAITQGFPPEKQRLFERAFQVGKNIIYEKQVFGGIVKQVDSNDPATGLAETIVLVLGTIEKDKQVGQLPLDVAMASGMCLLGDLVDALQKTGRGPYGKDVLSKAFEIGTQMYLQLNGGRIPPEELRSQVDQLKAYLGGAK